MRALRGEDREDERLAAFGEGGGGGRARAGRGGGGDDGGDANGGIVRGGVDVDGEIVRCVDDRSVAEIAVL